MIENQTNHKAYIFLDEATNTFDGRVFEITVYGERDIKSFVNRVGAYKVYRFRQTESGLLATQGE